MGNMDDSTKGRSPTLGFPAGRGHRYIAGVLPQAARKSALKHLTDKLFKGSSELLFTHLVSDQKLTPEQVRRMRQHWWLWPRR
jgi:predicted transcriptional regulator